MTSNAFDNIYSDAGPSASSNDSNGGNSGFDIGGWGSPSDNNNFAPSDNSYNSYGSGGGFTDGGGFSGGVGFSGDNNYNNMNSNMMGGGGFSGGGGGFSDGGFSNGMGGNMHSFGENMSSTDVINSMSDQLTPQEMEMLHKINITEEEISVLESCITRI